MKIIFVLHIATLLFLMSCDNYNIEGQSAQQNDSPIMGDIIVVNGTQNLGRGINSSSNSNQSLTCGTQLAFLPAQMKKWLVAYGVSASSDLCGHCTDYQFTCTPGETLEIETFMALTGDPVGTYETPTLFEANIGSFSSRYNDQEVCPASGTYTYSELNPVSTVASKIQITSDSGSDAEYIICE